MDRLKLAAFDAEDLEVLSAHLQDAVLTVGDIGWLPRPGRFALVARRFAWECCEEGKGRYERRLTGLHFDRVVRVQSRGIDRAAPDTVLELLAVRFAPGESPGGAVELVFAGGKDVRLEVECVEAGMSDLGVAWETARRPDHPGAEAR
jgi:hypothetical protein